MFHQLSTAPPDPILGLNEAFAADPRPEKINLSVGVYKDAAGMTPTLQCVSQAEAALLAADGTKAYLPITGLAAFCDGAAQLLLGAASDRTATGKVVTVQTPGGTGALRVAGDFLRQNLDGPRIWLSQPTWPNHPKIFAAAGLEVATYPYCDASGKSLDPQALMDAVSQIPAGDVLLLHGCCHNPTGVDLPLEYWEFIGKAAARQGFLVLVDFAYQGFASGLEEDAAGLRRLLEFAPELIVCSSYSKNFGLYSERVGALTLVAQSSEDASNAQSQLKLCVRSNYSNPPRHGASVVAHVLGDPELRKLWEQEVGEMRDRINGLRKAFVTTMRDLKAPVAFDFIQDQRGMFSFSGLGESQVDQLREEHAIYMVRNGRMNVAGINEENLPRICERIVSVL